MRLEEIVCMFDDACVSKVESSEAADIINDVAKGIEIEVV